MKILLPIRRYQSGQASFETVLVLPLIFFFLILIFQSIKASWLWLDRVIDARNSAWQTELYFASDASASGMLLGAEVLTNPADRFSSLTSGNVQNVKAKNTVSFSAAADGEGGAGSLLIADKWLQDVRKIPNDEPGKVGIKTLTASIEEDKPGGITGVSYSTAQRLGFKVPIEEQVENAMAAALLSVVQGGDLKAVLGGVAGNYVRREEHISDFSQGWRIDPVAAETEGYDKPLKDQLGDGSEFLEHIK